MVYFTLNCYGSLRIFSLSFLTHPLSFHFLSVHLCYPSVRPSQRSAPQGTITKVAEDGKIKLCHWLS